jgi:ComF family protein
MCGYLEEPLCSQCRERLPFEPHVRPLFDKETGELLQIGSAMMYEPNSVTSRLIHGLKYQHQSDVYRYFVSPLRETLKLFWEPSRVILVPVPLHRKRELERGYNQAELLAKALAREWGVPLFKGLKRSKETGAQAQLTKRSARQANMRDVFSVDLHLKALPQDSQILLIDDIVTTGSTLLACRSALQSAGFEQVGALTLADRPLIHEDSD